MIILDTDILSALMLPGRSEALTAWLDAQRNIEIWTTAITVFEIENGIEALPKGQRQQMLRDRAAIAFGPTLLGGRILAFDARAAGLAGRIFAGLAARGQATGISDTQIAGVALAHGATLATRNTRHFERVEGLRLLNPWP